MGAHLKPSRKNPVRNDKAKQPEANAKLGRKNPVQNEKAKQAEADAKPGRKSPVQTEGAKPVEVNHDWCGKRSAARLGMMFEHGEKTRIKFIQKNPKREGTESHRRYERYKKCVTLRDACMVEMTVVDFHFDRKRNYVQVIDGGKEYAV